MTRGALESSVTLEEVFTVLRAKRVPLAPELAGYLVLEIAEHADPRGGDVDPRTVFIGEEGTVALVKPRRDAPSASAEASVRTVLAHLLEASGSQTPALAAASKRASGSGLAALAGELETALIPVNRAAGRRALARLAREVRRVTLGVGRNALPSSSDAPARRTPSAPHGLPSDTGPAPPRSLVAGPPREEPPPRVPQDAPLDRSSAGSSPITPSSGPPRRPAARTEPPADLDSLIDRFGVPAPGPQHHSRELKAMAGLEPTPPPAAAAAPGAGDATGDLDELQAAKDIERALAGGYDRPIAGEPSLLEDASIEGAPRRPRTGLLRFALILGVLAAALGAYAALRPRPFAAVPEAPQSSVAAASPAPRAETLCRGTLVVSDVPPRAEVLLREGQAPVDMERMPVGTRLEFVATAEGYVPKRVVVPAAAPWSPGADGKPYLETTVQLDKSRTGDDPWPAGEPGGATGGRGSPGTIRVTSNPRGAEIWRLAGFGPDSRIERLGCDRAWDVLVAGPGTFRRRMRVAPRDFRAEGPAAAPVARLSAR